jgi:hypothetical protein
MSVSNSRNRQEVAGFLFIERNDRFIEKITAFVENMKKDLQE